MAEVVLEKLRKIYEPKEGFLGRRKGEGVLAVNDIDLTIEDGEFLALLGPSGCGKTTTLRMIVGLEEITSGEIRIDGVRINEMEPKDRGVGLAFETYALYPPLTVRDNIGFCLKAQGIPQGEIQKRVNEVARIVDATSFLDRYPAELGSGEKQRVTLARALVRNPQVLLMDEPLSHLDAAHRSTMRTELKRLHTEIGATTVLVTHDQLEAIAMADRVAIMNKGILEQVGTANEIYNRPVNEFVADFVGEPPINFLLCELTSQEGVPFFRGPEGSFSIEVPRRYRPNLEKLTSKRVRIGIRPLNINASFTEQTASLGETVIKGVVSTYESLGEEGLLTVQIGEEFVMIVMGPGLDIQVDQEAWLKFSNERMLVFDAETGIRIEVADES